MISLEAKSSEKDFLSCKQENLFSEFISIINDFLRNRKYGRTYWSIYSILDDMNIGRRKLAWSIGLSGIAVLGAFGLLGVAPFSRQGTGAPTVTPAVTPSAFSITTRSIQFVFGGDVMLGRMVGYLANRRGDYSYPFQDVAPFFRAADAGSVNLESPLLETCAVSSASSMRFCAEPEFAQALAQAGIATVSFANNHMLDQGAQGVRDTNALLSGAGIRVVNHASSTIEDVRGKKIGFVSFNLTWGNVGDEEIRTTIQDLRNRSDFTVVNFHWGEEYRATPTEEQKRIGRLAVDAGADVVVGHHPHVLEPIEQYKGKYIFYSLGNLVFDQSWSQATMQSALVKLSWSPDTDALSYELVPFVIDKDGRARILDQDATTTQEILRSLGVF